MSVFASYGTAKPSVSTPGMVWLPLYSDLLSWSQTHNPDHLKMLESIDTRDSADFTLKCIGSLFRRRAKSDVGWVWQVLREKQADVLAVCEHITPGDKRVCDLWPPNGGTRGAWRQWIKQLEPLDDIEFWMGGGRMSAVHVPPSPVVIVSPAAEAGLFR